MFGKNLHRFANPYTSNLDLSDVSIANSWITFNTAGVGNYKAPTEVYTNALRFEVYKVANNHVISDVQGGTISTTGNTLLKAFLSKNTATPAQYFWTGSAEALLIKPYEAFHINYYTLNSSAAGNGSRIISANLELKDYNKTFAYDFSGVITGDGGLPGVFYRSATSNNTLQALQANETLVERGLVTDFDFTQVEVYLSKNKEIQGSAAYLLNANFMTTGNATTARIENNPIFFYEEDAEGNVYTNAENVSNSFNSEDYIGKPLRVGFKDLEIGANYQLNLNLFEYSILNKVNDLTLGKYYLLDKVQNKVHEIDGKSEFSFVADANVNDRFEFYRNESPRTLGSNDINAINATYLYTANQNQFVRFEDKNTTANIEVFDLQGRLISQQMNVKTNTDYQLDLRRLPSVYVVKIVYQNGKVVTKKTINK